MSLEWNGMLTFFWQSLIFWREAIFLGPYIWYSGTKSLGGIDVIYPSTAYIVFWNQNRLFTTHEKANKSKKHREKGACARVSGHHNERQLMIQSPSPARVNTIKRVLIEPLYKSRGARVNFIFYIYYIFILVLFPFNLVLPFTSIKSSGCFVGSSAPTF